MSSDRLGVIAAWRHADRSRLVLCDDGSLHRARPKREYVVVGTGVSRAEAERKARQWGFRPATFGGVGRPILGPKRKTPRRRKRVKAATLFTSRSGIPRGYEAYHEARILAEQARVQADLARLGASA